MKTHSRGSASPLNSTLTPPRHLNALGCRVYGALRVVSCGVSWWWRGGVVENARNARRVTGHDNTRTPERRARIPRRRFVCAYTRTRSEWGIARKTEHNASTLCYRASTTPRAYGSGHAPFFVRQKQKVGGVVGVFISPPRRHTPTP